MSLTKEELQLVDGLKLLAAEEGPVYFTVAEVQSVTQGSTYTCSVITNAGDTISDVRLRTVVNGGKNAVLVPVIYSYVGITRIDKSNQWVVAAVDEIDQIIWDVNDIKIDAANNIVINGGKNDGMVMIKPLITKLNNAEKKINDLIDKWNSFCSSYIPGSPATTGSPSTLANSSETKLTTTSQSDLEDTKITH